MAVFEVSVAAATAALGYDLLTGAPEVRNSAGARVITGMALTGSAAASDSEVELRVGGEVVARVRNITTGNPNNDHIQPLNVGVLAGAPIAARVTVAPATNPLILRIIVEDYA